MPIGKEMINFTAVEGKHLYENEGKIYPSVTTVLDAISYNKAIVKWANHLGFNHVNYETELQRTATEGTYMHAMAQCIVDPEHGQVPTIPDNITDYYVRKRIEGLRFKLNDAKGHWDTVCTETPILSHHYKIGGTMDWLAHWYDKLTLFDFKSSSSLRLKHVIQLGGYNLMLEDNGVCLDQAGIILCRKDRCIIKIIPKDILLQASQIFLVVYDYYNQHNYLEEAIAALPAF